MELLCRIYRYFSWRHLSFALFLVLSITDLVSCRGARGGSFRGGGSIRSGIRSSSRSGSGGFSSSRSGARISSSYVSYVPAVRYSRAYSSVRNNYYYYYSRYFIFMNSYAYRSRSAPDSTANVCVNYEANDNGTTMGVFVCPLDFEPEDFTACCGESYAEYCCEPYNGPLILGCVLGGIAGVVILAMCGCFIKNRWDKRARVTARDQQQNNTRVTRGQGQGQGQHNKRVTRSTPSVQDTGNAYPATGTATGPAPATLSPATLPAWQEPPPSYHTNKYAEWSTPPPSYDDAVNR